jgi:hypothetical protein
MSLSKLFNILSTGYGKHHDCEYQFLKMCLEQKIKMEGPCVYVSYMYVLNHFYRHNIDIRLASKAFADMGGKLSGVHFSLFTEVLLKEGLDVEVCKDPSLVKEFVNSTSDNGSALLVFGIRNKDDRTQHCTMINPSVKKNVFYDTYLDPDQYQIMDCLRISIKKQPSSFVCDEIYVIDKKIEVVDAYKSYCNAKLFGVLEPASFTIGERISSLIANFKFIFKSIFSLIKIKLMRYLIALLWIFVVAANLSAQATFVNPEVKQKSYEVLVQRGEVLQQTLAGLTPGQEYVMSFDAVYSGTRPCRVLRSVVEIDGIPRDTVVRKSPSSSNENFTFTASNVTANFTVRVTGKWSKKHSMTFSNFKVKHVNVTYSNNLTSFNAFPTKNLVILDWTTCTDVGSRQWEVMRAGSDMIWERIATVESSGTIEEGASYLYTDYSPLYEDSYYRLWHVDNNGKVTQSNIVSVIRQSLKTRVQVKNDYESGVVTIHMNNLNQYSAAIIDQTGELIKLITSHAVRDTLQVDVSDLSSGDYYINLTGRIDANMRATIPFSVVR